MKETTTLPPYTNRWGATPGPDFRRCQGDTKQGAQCRAAAQKGTDYCDQHEPSRVPICTDLDEDCHDLNHLGCYLYDPGKGRCPFLSKGGAKLK